MTLRATNVYTGCYVEKTFELVCVGPSGIKADKTELCPGEKTTLRVQNNDCVSWSIEGDSLGSVLRPEPCSCCQGGAGEHTATLIAGQRSGVVTIVARNCNHNTCPDGSGCDEERIRVRIGCGDSGPSGCADCGGSSVPGNGQATLGSVSAWFSMGLTTDGRSAGRLTIEAEHPSPTLPTPRALRFLSDPPQVTVYRLADGTIRQVKAPQALADVVFTDPADERYEIRFYASEQVTYVGAPPEAPWAPDPNESPYVTWVVERPAGAADYSELWISKYIGGSPGDGQAQLALVYRYEYTSSTNPEQWSWTLHTGPDATTDSRLETLTWTRVDATTWSRQYVAQQDGGVVQDVTETWQEFSWGKAVTQRSVNAGAGVSLVSTFGYVPSANGLLQYEILPDGSWSWYMYDTDGRIESVYAPWGDAVLTPPTPPDPATSRKVTYTYDPVTDRVASVTEEVSGIVVSHTEYEYTQDDPANPTEWYTIEKRCTTPGGPCSFLVTTTAYLDEARTKVKWIDFPDGRRDSYAYEQGTFNGSTTDPQFTPGTGDFERVTVTHLGVGASPVPQKTTQETVVRDQAGLVRLRETYAYVQGVYTRVGWEARFYDERGRVVDVYYSDGTNEHYERGCCGSDLYVDRRGVRTQTVIDPVLQRVTSRTKLGLPAAPPYDAQPDITTTYDFNVANDRRTETTTVSDPNGHSVVTSREFDLAGRVVRETDAAGLVTQYAYGVASGGGRKVTVTRPGGQTEVTEYYRDGRVKASYGTGVVARTYEYGVQSDGTQWTKVYIGPDGTGSPRWTKTVYDALGRVAREERPAFSSSEPVRTEYTYDDVNGGRLKSTQPFHGSTPLQAAKVYEYDALGNVVRTGLDLDGNGVLDEASSDRISETDTQFVTLNGDVWRETVRRTWLTEGDATATVLERRRERLTGLGAGVTREVETEDPLGNITRITTTLDPNDALETETTSFPPTGAQAVRVTRNGLLVSETDRADVTTTYRYDGLGRRTHVIRDRNDITIVTTYDDAGRVASVSDPAGTTVYAYYGAQDPSAGRLRSIRNADGKYTYYAYNDLGQVTRVWGDAPQPVEFGYDDFGQRISMETFRDTNVNWSDPNWPGANVAGDVTTWGYDPATGLLTQKTYADGTSVQYTYTADGKLYERFWARTDGSGQPVRTTYRYYDYTVSGRNTGELRQIDYDDSYTPATPDVTFSYTRHGQLASVTDGVGTREFVYDAYGQRLREKFTSGLFQGLRVTSEMDYTVLYQSGQTWLSATLPGLGAIRVGVQGNISRDYAATYSYDPDTARLEKVTGPGLPSGGAWYSYEPDSHLVRSIEYKQDTTVRARVSWSWEPDRDLARSVSNEELISGSQPVLVSRFTYGYDALGRRTWVVREGSAFATGHQDAWGYNARNELISSDRYNSTDPANPTNPVPALDRSYDYDPIGNRTSYDEGEPASGGTPFTYATNELNQYTRVNGGPLAAEGLAYDADGNLTDIYAAADVNRDGVVDISDLDLVLAAFGCCEGNPCYNPDADIDGDRCVGLEDLTAVQGLFGTTAPAARLTWDAENRLVGYEPLYPADGDRKVAFAYDYLGRRVEKKVWTWDPNGAGGSGAWVLTSHRRFIWYNWLLLLELDALDHDGDGQPDNAVIRKYTWGLDLAGLHGQVNSLEAAGGIGGLLAIEDPDDPNDPADPHGSFACFFDANGNLAQLVDLADGSLAARYEYDPYGNLAGPDTNGDGVFDPTTDDAGPYAAENPVRFSTKSWDAETGFGYWGYRYYSPRLGRWLSRDPIEELGGINVYVYVSGEPTDLVDPLGERQYAFDFNWTLSGAGLSIYGRAEVTDAGPCCAEVNVFAAAEWQPPFLRFANRPLAWVKIHIEAGVRGGVKFGGRVCMGQTESLRVCGRFEVFLRAEYRKGRVQEWGRRKRFTRMRFGVGADGGVDLCWDLCTGSVTLGGQINAWVYAHFGWGWFNRSYSASWQWASGEREILHAPALLQKYCCLN